MLKLYEISPTTGYGVYQVFVIASSEKEAIQMACDNNEYILVECRKGNKLSITCFELTPGYKTEAIQ